MNILDFFGLISIITFLFSDGSQDHNNVFITILLVGLGLSFYRGFKSLCIFFDNFMVSFMTLLRSFFSLKMFALVILAQIFLFAVMNSIKEIHDHYKNEEFDIDGLEILTLQVYDHLMKIIKGPKPVLDRGDYMRNFLFILYQIFMNIISMKLMISVIGVSFGFQRINTIFMLINMKIDYMNEFLKIMCMISNCGSKVTSETI